MTPARTLGVLGGMGPAAGAELVCRFTARWPARRDQDHPRIILLSEPAIPDRTAALRGLAPDPTEPIMAALRQLAAWGADLIAVPCNTAFIFIDSILDRLPVPVIDIVATVLAEARRSAPGGAWLLATDGTVDSRLYHSRAEPAGYRLRLPGPVEQRIVSQSVAAVKAGDMRDAGALLNEAMRRLNGVAAVPFLLACTELPLAWQEAGRPGQAVDCLDALAAACVRALAGSTTERWGANSVV